MVLYGSSKFIQIVIGVGKITIGLSLLSYVAQFFDNAKMLLIAFYCLFKASQTAVDVAKLGKGTCFSPFIHLLLDIGKVLFV